MATLSITTSGFGGVTAALGRLQDAAATHGGATLSVATKVPWGYGLETGRHRSGRLARRAGGAYMFRRGAEEGLRGAGGRIARALPSGPQAVVREWLAIGRETVTQVRHHTPRVTGYTASTVEMHLDVGHLGSSVGGGLGGAR